jgi:putative type I restriction-modification system, specificity determinant
MMNILEEIQNCPVEWKELGEVAEVGTGNNNTNEQVENGKYPFYVRSKNIKTINTYLFDEEAIVIPGEGDIGKIFHYVKGKYGLHQRAYRIHITVDNIKTKFIYYYMHANFKSFITKKAVSATVSSIRKPMIEKFPIPIPPREIQEKIVQILDKFTDYVTELTSELTSRKKQYSFYRDKLLSFEDEVYQVEWKTIQDISVKIVTGVTPKKSCEDYYLKGTIPWLRTNEVKFNTITTTEKYVTERAVEETGLKWISPNSIIIAISGATAGRVAMNSIPLTTNQHCCSISVDERIVNYKYLYYWLVNQNRQILSLKQGARGDINMSMIKSLKIPVPSLEIQSRIIQVLDNFDTVCNDLNIGLPKEIELRQKQYEYFRDKLLTFVAEGEYTDSTVQYRQDIIRLLNWVFGPIQVKLGQVINLQRGKRLVRNQLTTSGSFPVYQNSLTPLGYFTDSNRPKGTSFIICAGAAGEIGYSDTDFWAADDVYTLETSDSISDKFIYYVLLSKQDRLKSQVRKASIPRLSKDAIDKVAFYLPPLAEQESIVSILDNFNTLTNSLSEGLPKEIELRQKQYEYWREQLLNFTR